MSHLREPAARADRREGGRHGRPVTRTAPSLPETPIRPQLLRLAVLPPIAVALSAGAAVLFTVRSTGARPGLTLWGVLAGAVSVALAGIVIAAIAADRAARSVSDRVGALRRSSARGEADLRALVEALRRGETPAQRKPRGAPADDADDFELLAADLSRAHDGAVTAVVQAAQLSSQAGSEQKLEVFVNLARRLQSLVHREISILDELENEIEDPDLLKGLFHVDHLATRIRRHAENLAVLGGAVSRRQWSHPVSMTEVLRSAIAEVEQYSRVKLVPPIDGTLRGHAVADVIHLLAELVENATVFSAPHTQVLLRANLVTSGLAVEVEDRGLGMPVVEQKKMNALLADPDQVNVASLLADGRIGLFVVSQLARRHGINVRLQTNIYGGVQAVLVVPQGLLGTTPGVSGAVPQPQGVTGTAVPPRPSPSQSSPTPGPESGVRRVPAPGPRRGRQQEDTRSAAPTPNGSTPPGAAPNGGAASGGLGGGRAAGGDVLNGGVPSGGMADGPAAGGGVASGGMAGGPAAGGGVLNGAAATGYTVGGGLAGNGASGGGLAGNGESRGGLVGNGESGGARAAGGMAGGVPNGPVTDSSSAGGAVADGSTASWAVVNGIANGVVADGSTASGTVGGGITDGVVAGDPAAGSGSAADGGGPAPLPVRGAHAERPNPAEAVPGIRPDDRRLVAENVAGAPVPRTGPVRGTMGKPRLPRRRAQEHIVPQLRDGPAPRQDTECPVGHDPGLMAAFQRGIGLAEAQQHLEAGHTELDHTGSHHTAPAHVELPHMDPLHMDPLHMDRPHMEPLRTDPVPGAPHTSALHTPAPTHLDASHADATHTNTPATTPSPATDVSHTDVSHTEVPHMDAPRMDPAHIAEARPASARAHDHTTRHDGSEPAG